MPKILIVWDVKSRGSAATSFYRALFGYDYRTKSGRCHSPGVLDELPRGVWECVSRSTLLIEAEYAALVEKVFKEFEAHLKWFKFLVSEAESYG